MASTVGADQPSGDDTMRHAAPSTTRSEARLGMRRPINTAPGRHARRLEPLSDAPGSAALLDTPTEVIRVDTVHSMPNTAGAYAREAVNRSLHPSDIARGTWDRMTPVGRTRTLSFAGFAIVGLVMASFPLTVSSAAANASSDDTSTRTTTSNTSTTTSRADDCAMSAAKALDTTAQAMATSPSSDWLGEVAVGQVILGQEFGDDAGEVHAFNAGAYDVLAWMSTPASSAPSYASMARNEAVPHMRALCSDYY